MSPLSLGVMARSLKEHERRLPLHPDHLDRIPDDLRDDLPSLTPGTLIVDVSCDEGMGFSWARPTTFTDPTFVVGDNVLYYAVDHSPSHLWNSATWEISEALIPFLGTILGGSDTWDTDPTVSRAIEIRNGVIQNPAILSFQGRAPEYPHVPLAL